MANELTVQNTRALTIRSYLMSEKSKNTLKDVVPKWLTVDRMLRVTFSSVMRNQKLMECTPESILQSVMMCAQLGLEPILGRAYLVPYSSSKRIDGQWQRVSECQMQPGYQGLIDLARRSGVISDVWSEVVYENDQFDIEYGMNRNLIHRPWFVDKDKRNEGPGAIIGAYCVWELKDGTRHPEFMSIHDIYKRRDMSQSYKWAETGDPSKGGGKQDSIWHLWPDEQIKKTVVKHSCKFVPASIDFMEAIEIDNDVEVGNHAIKPNVEMIDIDSTVNTVEQLNPPTSYAESNSPPPQQEDQVIEQEPQAWVCLESPVLQRYSQEKRESIRLTADNLGVDIKGLKPQEAHQKILDASLKSEEVDAEFTETQNSVNQEMIELTSYFNDASDNSKLMLDTKEKFNYACKAAGISPGSRPTSVEQGNLFRSAYEEKEVF